MSNVGTLSVGITGDSSGLKRSLDDAKKSVDKFSKSADEMARKFSAVGTKMTGAGKKLSLAVTAPIVAFGAAAVKFASDAEEIQSKFNIVFGETAIAVEEWIAEFADSVGRSKTALKEFASSFQDTFVPLGATRIEASELSKQLVELTVDLASFNNAAEPDVMRALQSAIVGNHETVRRFGVIITQATLEQELFNMGITDGVDAATNLEKAQARLNLILAGTTDAQGDATRTADSFANRLKALRATMRDVSEEIGEILIPVVQEIIGRFGEWLQKFRDLDPQVKENIVKIGLLVAAIGPALIIVGQLTKAVGGLITALSFLAAHPMVALISALAAVGAGMAYFGMSVARYTRPMEDLGEETDRTLEKVKGFGEIIIETDRVLRDAVGPDESATAFHDLSGTLDFAAQSIIDLQMRLLDIPLQETAEEVEEVTEAVEEMTEAFSTEVIEAAEAAFSEYSEALAATKEGSLDYIVAVQQIQQEYAALLEAQDAIIEQGEELDPRLEDLIERYEELGIAFDNATPKAKTLRQAMEEFLRSAERNWTSTLNSMVSSVERITGTLFDGIADMVNHNRELAESYKDIQQDIIDTQREAIDQANEEMIRARNNVRHDLSQGEIDAQEYANRMADIEEDYTRQVHDAAVARENALKDAREAYEEEKRTLGEVLKDTLKMIISSIKQELNAEASKHAVRGVVAALLGDEEAAQKHKEAAVALYAAAAGLSILGFEKGGIVGGALGEPVPAIVHGGEMVLTPEQQAGMFDYSMFSQAVANGVYEAMNEVLPGKERPMILQVDGTRFARVMVPALSREEQRLGLATA